MCRGVANSGFRGGLCSTRRRRPTVRLLLAHACLASEGAPDSVNGGGGSSLRRKTLEDDPEAVRFRFEGIERSFGVKGLRKLYGSHVCVIGIGGVGSWAAEALARSGIGTITLIDLDEVCISNINRQVHSVDATVGRPKCAAMKERILSISPSCTVHEVNDFVLAENAHDLMESHVLPCDYVIDAIDNADNKCHILNFCHKHLIPVVTLGGGGGLQDAYSLRTTPLEKATHDKLLARVRKTLRQDFGFSRSMSGSRGQGGGRGEKSWEEASEWGIMAVTAWREAHSMPDNCNAGSMRCGPGGFGGSLCHVTGSMGFMAAGYVINSLVHQTHTERRAVGTDQPGASTGREGVDVLSMVAPGSLGMSGSSNGFTETASSPAARVVYSSTLLERDASGQDESQDALQVQTGEPKGKEAAVGTYFDAHCHVHLQEGNIAKLREVDALPGVGSLALMATSQEEWDTVCNLSAGGDQNPTLRDAKRVYGALGVHPWYAHRQEYQKDDAWLRRLEHCLLQRGDCIVGEIGLDKKWKPPETSRNHYEEQKEVFAAQMELAARLKRPVSLHCVACYGDLFDMCREWGRQNALPPKVYLHSYGGSADMVKQFVNMKNGGDRFYFGFSHVVNSRTNRSLDAIKKVPDDRLLLESDLSAMDMQSEDLHQAAQMIAQVKGLTVAEIAALTTRNGRTFFAM